MTALRKQSLLFRLCRVIIKAAALLVPESSRADWKQEWMAEISWKLGAHGAWGRIDALTQARLFYRSLGSFIDAFILRWDFLLSLPEAAPMALVDRQPLFLGLAFFILLTLCNPIARPWVISRYGFSSPEYLYCYWVTDATYVLTLYGILFLLYRCALLGATRIWGSARLILGGLLVITWVLSGVQTWDSPGSWFRWFLTFEVYVTLLLLPLSLTLLLAVRRLESAQDLALPVYGLLFLVAPSATLIIRWCPHDSVELALFHWVSICSPILAFAVWGYAYVRARRSPSASSRAK
jgi:hypothetical protein